MCDFGLALTVEDATSSVRSDKRGTAQYAAPELLRNGSLCRSSDVYSFGMIAWHLVSAGSRDADMTDAQICYQARPSCLARVDALLEEESAHLLSHNGTIPSVVAENNNGSKRHAQDDHHSCLTSLLVLSRATLGTCNFQTGARQRSTTFHALIVAQTSWAVLDARGMAQVPELGAWLKGPSIPPAACKPSRGCLATVWLLLRPWIRLPHAQR